MADFLPARWVGRLATACQTGIEGRLARLAAVWQPFGSVWQAVFRSPGRPFGIWHTLYRCVCQTAHATAPLVSFSPIFQI